MAWTDIPDKSTGDQMDETWYDTHFKANMEYLLSPSHEAIVRNNSGNYSTTSTSFVDVDATNLAVTLTTYGGPVLIAISALVYNTTSGNAVYLDVDIDGTRYGNSYSCGLLRFISPSASAEQPAVLCFLIKNLTAGSHTFKLQWCTAAGTANMRPYSPYCPALFSVIEI